MFEDADDNIREALAAWKTLPAKHQPQYPDTDFLNTTVDYLRTLPPLIFAGEADSLTGEIARASRGETFVLQGGDCAESFADATADRIRAKIRTILQMAVVLTYSASVPVVKLGRMAGQYAKPRSKPTEIRDGSSHLRTWAMPSTVICSLPSLARQIRTAWSRHTSIRRLL